VPIYEYRCDDCGASLEVLQKMSDDPLEICAKCGGHLSKVLHPVAIHFKGSGFYTTDYGKGSSRRTGGSTDDSSPSDASSASSSADTAKSQDTTGTDTAAPKAGKVKEKQKTT
jgi:putative FmdB family regulatory protein